MRNSRPEARVRDRRLWPKAGFSLALALFSFARVILGAPSTSTTSNAPAPVAVTNPAPIQLTEIPAQAESVAASLQTINADLAADDAVKTIERELPSITEEISVRAEETSRIIASGSSFETIRRLYGNWQEYNEELSNWKRSLSHRAAQLQSTLQRLQQMQKTWQLTSAFGETSNAPPAMLRQLKSTLDDLDRCEADVKSGLSLLLTLESRVAEQDLRVGQALASVDRARAQFVSHLLVRDATPIWSAKAQAETAQNLGPESHHAFARQARALRAYWERRTDRFLLQVLVFVALAGLLYWVRAKMRAADRKTFGLAQAARIFEMPLTAALLLCLLASFWIYPQAPRLLRALLGVAVLVPSGLLLWRLLDRRLIPILIALFAAFFLDQVRAFAASQPALSRWLLLIEMAGAGLFTASIIRAGTLPSLAARGAWAQKLVQLGAWGAALCFSVAFLADALGYLRLAHLLGNAVLNAGYIALVLYVLLQVLDALIEAALRMPPFDRVKMIDENRAVLERRARSFLEFAAVIAWLLAWLETLALRAPFIAGLTAALTARLSIGSIAFSFGDVLLFGFTIWAAFLVSRIVRFVLEVEVYPRVQMAPGLHYSISKTLHYLILLAGFLLALALLGFNLTKLTIIAGAFGVGLGFGMQNIVNNFVSGIILLFERPVKVGDVIQLDSAEGVVRRIGIRASVVRTLNGSEVIVPNSKLISDPVTNWTFSHRRRLITLPCAVPAGTDPNKVLEILRNAAAQHPHIVKDPPPQALLLNFSGSAINFEVRAWTDQAENWQQVRSELYQSISSALAAQKIAIQ